MLEVNFIVAKKIFFLDYCHSTTRHPSIIFFVRVAGSEFFCFLSLSIILLLRTYYELNLKIIFWNKLSYMWKMTFLKGHLVALKKGRLFTRINLVSFECLKSFMNFIINVEKYQSFNTSLFKTEKIWAKSWVVKKLVTHKK